MAKPSSDSVRAFWAIRPPEDVIDALVALGQKLKAPCEKLGLKVSWVPAESMHITLKFLGSIDENAIPGMVARVQSGLLELKLPTARFFARGLSAFPSLVRPRVLVVQTHGETGDGDLGHLTRMQSSLEGWMEEFGHAREERDFHPHLTIGRVREGRSWPGSELMQLYTRHGEQKLGGSFESRELILYESRMDSTGARYTPLSRLSLNGEK